VREAIFSHLFDRIVDATVLDLFAGSGALAFEALSRGAARVIAVDHDPAVIRHLEAQAGDFGVSGQIEVVYGDAIRFLTRGRMRRPRAELVLLDPPYAEVAIIGPILSALADGEWLAGDAEIIVERARKRGSVGAGELPAGFRSERSRDYGQTCVEFLRSPPRPR
jgi:16S rRNA (guanine966-N2)-methyltransferase